MSVRVDPSGRRSVELTLEVPGTPDEVWRAIATGPGISSWFVPASNTEENGRPVSQSLTFGPGMISTAAITHWDAPRMYAKESKGWLPGSPNMATEWHVEATSGGTCIVRIVHSLFASTDEWDSQLDGAANGWPAFLATLQLYLTHFRGEPSTLVQLSAPTTGSDADVWQALTSALGVDSTAVGDTVQAPADAPPLRGVLAYQHTKPYDALVRIDTPARGIAALGVASWPGGPTMAAINFYCYGDDADTHAAAIEPIWSTWLTTRFPAPEPQT